MAQQALDRSLDWSPSSARNERQSQSQSLGQGHNNQLHGQGQLNGDAAKPSSYLQPYPLLAGPRSQELLRRSSSRRRRLKFTLGIEDDELKEDVETMKVPDVAPNILIETTPLICRKHDVAGEVNPSYSPRCTSRV